jgi:adenylylsulfate kinase-like enzyme
LTNSLNNQLGANTVTHYNDGFTLWLTGLSGAGKTIIALALEKELRARRLRIERLDGASLFAICCIGFATT